ncbi:baseplate J/gp47 family protein [Anaerotignum propionicum]|uniref:baseplate assembly protein n=1 Tax=Anaerotignum propionicum TaxID=28446 RepID=UPI00289805FA|nr:baseplate J/gp47 family protein [Anaerotignum propionicum]
MSKIDLLKNVPDISFIENTTLAGLKEEMLADYVQEMKALTGESQEIPQGDPVRLVLNSVALALYQAMQYVDRAGKMNLLKYSYGNFLDNVGALKKLARKEPSFATVTLRFSMDSARGQATSISGGTRVATQKGLYFMTDQYAEIPAGETAISVKGTALEAGMGSNEIPIGVITEIVDPIPYIKSVTNITVSEGGAEMESDAAFTERIYNSPSGYSTAGATEAYEYHAKDYHTNVSDVKAYSPSENQVVIVFLMNDGRLPTETERAGMLDHLSKDKIRPLTDHVTVSPPQEKEYNVSLNYFINRSDQGQAVAIQTAVAQAVEGYLKWQRKLGRDINPSELIKRVIIAGAKRVELTTPTYGAVNDYEVSKCTGKTINFGGVEDD